MRSFNFVFSSDPHAQDQLPDLRDQIEAAGHAFGVTNGRFVEPPTINLFNEGIPEAPPELMLELARSGYQLIALVTELPTLVTERSFVWNYFTESSWVARAVAFIQTTPALISAWCYAPGAARTIRRYVPRAIDVDISWGKRFERPRPAVVPRYDFCFYGSQSPRRAEILDGFRRAGFSIDVIPIEVPVARRDARIPDSRVVLDIKQFDWWPLVSSVRYATALFAGRPVVAEPRSVEAAANWNLITRFAASDDAFIDEATAVLEGWAQEYDSQLRAFRDHSVTGVIARAIEALPVVPAKPIMVSPPGEATAPVPGFSYARPTLLDTAMGYNIVGWKNGIYVVPHVLGPVDLDRINHDAHSAIQRFTRTVDAWDAIGRAAGR